MTKRKSPAEAETEAGSTTEFTWEGETFALPGSLDDCDMATVAAMRIGDPIGFVQGVLGPQEWQRFLAVTRGKPHRARDVQSEILKALGFAKGE